MLNATRRRVNTWVSGIVLSGTAAIVVAIVVSFGTTSSSFADPYVNSCGEWTIIETVFSEEIREFAVYLDGVEEFVMTREFSDVETAVHVEVGGFFASCYFHESENVDHCDAFASLLQDPLICDGTMSIADLLDEMFPPAPAVPPVLQATAQGNQSGPTTPCTSYFDFNKWIWVCECEDDDYDDCFECCETLNPEPHPGSTLPWRRVRNCMANCDRDACTCECDGGWFCGAQSSWCGLVCLRKIILS